MEGATGTGVAEEPTKTKPDPPPIQEEPENKPPPTGEEENPNHPKPEIKEEPKPSSSPPQTQGTKRKLASHGDFRNTNYFKIRSIIRDLRPLFLQEFSSVSEASEHEMLLLRRVKKDQTAIHAPDLRENEAVGEIRKQMKTMIELSRQLRAEEYCSKPQKLPTEQQTSDGASKLEKKPQNGNVPILVDDMKEKIEMAKKIAEHSEEESLQGSGSYVIGGSPIGWNFLVYPGRESVYYGETKSSFRSRQAAEIIVP